MTVLEESLEKFWKVAGCLSLYLRLVLQWWLKDRDDTSHPFTLPCALRDPENPRDRDVGSNDVRVIAHIGGVSFAFSRNIGMPSMVVVVVARGSDDDYGWEEGVTTSSRYISIQRVRSGRPWPCGLVLVRRRIEQHYVPPTLGSAGGTFL